MQRDTTGLTTENKELKLRLQAMEQQAQLRDGISPFYSVYGIKRAGVWMCSYPSQTKKVPNLTKGLVKPS